MMSVCRYGDSSPVPGCLFVAGEVPWQRPRTTVSGHRIGYIR